MQARPDNEDCNMKFLRALPPSWSQVAITLKTKGGLDFLSFDDLYNKLRTLEIDVKDGSSYDSRVPVLLHHSLSLMAMLSVRINRFENRLGEGGFKDRDHESEDMEKGASEVYGMIAGYGDDAVIPAVDAADGVSTDGIFADGVFVATGNGSDGVSVAAGVGADGVSVTSSDATDAETQFALMGLSPQVQSCPFGCNYTELKKDFDNLEVQYKECFIQVQAYKSSLQNLEQQKSWYQNNQLALEEKIRILTADLGNTTNMLKYTEKLNEQAKIDNMNNKVKLEESEARFDKWKNSSKNLNKLINSSMSSRSKFGLGYGDTFGTDEVFDLSAPSIFDSCLKDAIEKPLYDGFVKAGGLHAVPGPITGTFMPPSNKPDIDDTQFTYGSKSNNSSDTNSVSNDFVSCDNSDKSSDSETTDFASCVSSVQTSSSKTNEPLASVSSSVDLKNFHKTDDQGPCNVTQSPSFSFKENVKTPRNLCNRNGSNNISLCKNKSFGSKKCFVCGSKFHLIRDCDFYENQLRLNNAPVWKNVENIPSFVPRPAYVPAGSRNRPTSVPAGRPFPAGWHNPAARPMTRPKSHYFQQFSRPGINNQLNNGGSQQSIGFSSYDPQAGPRQSSITNKDLGIIDSGCSRSMTCNKEKLANFVKIKGGTVTFGGGDVNGLPSKLFTNEHNCVACNKGKQHKASYKAITAVSTISEPLQLLHMDLFGPTSIRSIDHKHYSLVVTDDFSRFSWVFFLGTKDETFYILRDFITFVENQLTKKVKAIRCDNGTEFKNSNLIELCGSKGIKRDYSVARTPQQNGVAERKNRTLIEAARTMLADSKLPPIFGRVVSNACNSMDSDSDVMIKVIVVSFPSKHFSGPKSSYCSATVETDTVPAGSGVSATSIPAGNFNQAACGSAVSSTPSSSVVEPVHADTPFPPGHSLGSRGHFEKSKFGESALAGYVHDQQRNISQDYLIVWLRSILSTLNMCTRVVKLCYGLHQAPRAWISSSVKSMWMKLFLALLNQGPGVMSLSVDERRFEMSVWKSTTGGCQFLGRRLISWQCKKQTVVATSSTEAEYVAAAHCCDNWFISVVLHEESGIILMINIHSGWLSVCLLVREFLLVALNVPTGRTIPAGFVGFWENPSGSAGTSSGMDNMGYPTEGKLTFHKNKFSPQWRFIVHTLMHCLSTKSGSWDQFGSSLVNNITNPKKFLMFPRFLQMMLNIETRNSKQYHAFKLTSKMFANMRLNFHGDTMPLLATMLPPAQPAIAGESLGEAEPTDPHTVPETLMKPFNSHVQGNSSPPRRNHIPASAQENEQGPFYRFLPLHPPPDLMNLSKNNPLPSNVEDAGIWRFVDFSLKILKASDSKAHKLVFKEVVEYWYEAATFFFAAADSAVPTGDSNEDDIPPSSSTPSDAFTGGSAIPPDVSTDPTDAPSEKGKSPMLEEEPPLRAKEREEQKQKRQKDVLESAKYYTDADWNEIMSQVHATQGLSADLLGPGVNKDNFVARMVALIAERRRQFAAQRSFSDDQLKDKFDKIRHAPANLQSQHLRRSLKRQGADLEQPDSKKSKSITPQKTSVPAASRPSSAGVTPDVHQSPFVDTPPATPPHSPKASIHTPAVYT
ncbi:putative ribonuclease H-like domain-containing protein [Tanacetum coccineum]